MKILQISKTDISGGAERVAWDLNREFHSRMEEAWLAVSKKKSAIASVLQIPTPESISRWVHFWTGIQSRMVNQSFKIKGLGLWRGSKIIPWLANPLKAWDRCHGIEDFHYPGFFQWLGNLSSKPDVIHCHNLHGGYFDLGILPLLSRRMPVFLTLHDMWLLTGHCAHSFSCERWKSGCGHCPDLAIYPEIARDASAYNWCRKQKLYQHCRLYVATPSQWLMDKVKQSMLLPGVVEGRVIPNGVNLEVFNPGDKVVVRKSLGIPANARVLIFVANRIRNNPWKDYQLLRAVLEKVSMSLPSQELFFIALGEDAPPEKVGGAILRFVPYQKDAALVACYYQAADVYVHAARADSFPLTILEALACGTPVVATAVGGIPEQIDHGVTGYLVPLGDSDMMVARVVAILQDGGLRAEMGQKAVERARQLYDLQRQTNSYLEWYHEILGREPIAVSVK